MSEMAQHYFGEGDRVTVDDGKTGIIEYVLGWSPSYPRLGKVLLVRLDDRRQLIQCAPSQIVGTADRLV